MRSANMYTLLSSLTPISRLLLFGSEPDLTVFAREQLDAIHFAELDLDMVLSHAQRNYLAPLIYKNLKALSGVPEVFLIRFRQQMLASTLRQLQQEAVFQKLHDSLVTHNIDYRILKGYFLARHVYPGPNLRPMIDIDIMVSQPDILKVFEILKSQGFNPFPISERQFISDQKHHPYGLIYQGVAIELHKSIFSSYDPVKFNESILWGNPFKVNTSGRETYTLSPEVFLYHLCHHLMGHLQGDFIKLIWCRDIAEFLKVFEGKLDWDFFLHLYKISNANERLLHGLWFANDWMGASVPPHVLTLIRTPHIYIAQDFIWFTEHSKNDKPRTHLVSKFKEIKGWTTKLKYTLFRMFPVPGYLLRHYRKREKINLLYLYPYHFIYLFIKALKALK